MLSKISNTDRLARNAMKNKIFEDYNTYLQKLKIEFDENFKKKTECDYNIDHFAVITCLGMGSFGQVLLTRLIPVNKFFAMKVMSKAKIVKDKQVLHTYNEKCILEAMRFPFCLYMEYSFMDNSNVYFVLPYMAGGDMFTHLRKNKLFKEKDAKFYAAQVCLALEYIQYLDLVYRDLKPENIVMEPTGYIRLVDFGFCKYITDRTYTLCGTPEYIAPEIILCKGYGKSVDWWSFGVFLYEMIAGFTPFLDDEPMKIYEKISYGKYRFTTSFSSEAKDLIRNILQIDLTRRFGNLKDGVLDIKTHPWFRAIDWQAIHNRKALPPYIPKIKGPTDTTYFDKYEHPITFDIADTDKYADVFADF